MYCVKCGKANPDGAVFCGYCGTKLFVPSAARTQRDQAPAQRPVPAPVPAPAPAPAFTPAPAPARAPAAAAVPAGGNEPGSTGPRSLAEVARTFIRTADVREHPILRSELPVPVARVKTVRRPWNFEQIHEYFTLRNASFENVKTVLEQTDFAGIKVKIEPFPEEKSFAVLGRNFGCTLILQGAENGFYRWRFAFAKWNNHAYTIMMNGALSYVEQAFLAIDPDTVYEEKFTKIHTKTHFF